MLRTFRPRRRRCRRRYYRIIYCRLCSTGDFFIFESVGTSEMYIHIIIIDHYYWEFIYTAKLVGKPRKRLDFFAGGGPAARSYITYHNNIIL